MSANDIYLIRETSKGRYNISHEDVDEDTPRLPFVQDVSLDEALDCVEENPAEYGYRIIRRNAFILARMNDQEKDFEIEAKRQSRPDDVT